MKLLCSIAASTHIDKYMTRIAKEALEESVKTINSKYLPFTIEHNMDDVIGVVLCAKVLPMESNEWALVVVTGMYENDLDKKSFVPGGKNSSHKDYLYIIDELEIPLKSNAMSKEELEYYRPKNINEELENYLDSTKVNKDGKIYFIRRYIARTGDLKIEVLSRDHDGHFHVFSKQRGINARFNINTFEYIDTKQGKVSSSDKKKIQEFLKTHKEERDLLISEYQRMEEGRKW